MPTTTVRISEEAHQALRALAAQAGEPMQVILDRAIEQYRRQRFLEEANAAYAVQRRDPQAWQDERDERNLWDQTRADGLTDDR